MLDQPQEPNPPCEMSSVLAIRVEETTYPNLKTLTSYIFNKTGNLVPTLPSSSVSACLLNILENAAQYPEAQQLIQGYGKRLQTKVNGEEVARN